MRFGGDAIASCFRRYAGFRGRAPRSEYWGWQGFVLLVNAGITLVILGWMLVLPGIAEASGSAREGLTTAVTVLLFAVQVCQTLSALAILLPSLAVSIRRLHDLDRSGWWLLVALTGIGGILLLVWFCSRGTPGTNRFGPAGDIDIAAVSGGSTALTLGDGAGPTPADQHA